MYTKSNSTFAEIKSSLNKVYDRIRMKNTQEKGHELFKKLISKNISNKTLLSALINNIQDKISKLSPIEKPPYISLLSLFFFNQSTRDPLKFYYPYLSPVLSILQTLITDSNSEIFSHISETYGEIVQYLMPNDISASHKELISEEKELYETLQSFCIINIKIDQNINRIIGSLCLTKLVENCPFVLKNNYMKYILDNILENISKEKFNAKNELLNCLISLILGAESLFCSYAKITLYKVLDFLTDTDWLKRKLALNVIYTLIFYCKDEILPLKEHIINFLNVLKNDKIKEVREVSNSILQMFDDNKSIKTISSGINMSSSGVDLQDHEYRNEYNTNSNYKKVKVVKKKNNNSTKYLKSNKSNNNNKIISTSPNNYPNNKTKKISVVTNLNKRNYNTNIEKVTSNKRMNKEYSIPINDKKEKNYSLNKRNNSYEKRKIKEIKSNNSNINKDRDIYKNKERNRSIQKNKSMERNRSLERNKNIEREKSMEVNRDRENGSREDNKGRMSLSRSVNFSKEINMGLRYPKYVNRKKDYSFVNQKMVIKPDPNKSIFNSNKNMAFFNQAENQNNDVIVISKDIPNDNRKNFNTFNNFYDTKKIGFNKEENEEELDEEKENEHEQEKEKEKEQENEEDNNISLRERIDKDYDNSIGSINKLITLDAKIKTDNINNLKKDENKSNKKEEKKYKPKEKIKNKTYNKKKIYNNINDNNNNNNDNVYTNNRNINIEPNNNENKNNNNINSYNPNLINILLTEVRALSNKQISLLDLMDEIQTNTQQQIENLNQKIVDLDTTVRDLNHQLFILQKDQ